MPTILERKANSRFALARLDCGCETWLAPDRVGRRVKTCGPGFTHDAHRSGHPFGHFAEQAQRLLKETPTP